MCAVAHQHLDPVEVTTDIGIDAGLVAPTTAHSPAHDSNLNPRPILFTDQGSAWVTLESSVGEQDLGWGRRGQWRGW